MKPRFSILTLLAITAYVAVFAAAFAQPWGIWPCITFYLVMLLPVLIGDLVLERLAKQQQSGE